MGKRSTFAAFLYGDPLPSPLSSFVSLRPCTSCQGSSRNQEKGRKNSNPIFGRQIFATAPSARIATTSRAFTVPCDSLDLIAVPTGLLLCSRRTFIRFSRDNFMPLASEFFWTRRRAYSHRRAFRTASSVATRATRFSTLW